VGSIGLSDFPIHMYKLQANLRKWLGEVINIIIAVSKESIVERVHAIKAYWRLEIQLYSRRKGLMALLNLDAG